MPKKPGRKKSIKPLILSWLQKNPEAGVRPCVLDSKLSMRRPPSNQIQFISRGYLASTTASGLLFDHGNRGWGSRWLGFFFAPLRLATLASVICVTGPAKTFTGLGDSGHVSIAQMDIMTTPPSEGRPANGEKDESQGNAKSDGRSRPALKRDRGPAAASASAAPAIDDGRDAQPDGASF